MILYTKTAKSFIQVIAGVLCVTFVALADNSISLQPLKEANERLESINRLKEIVSSDTKLKEQYKKYVESIQGDAGKSILPLETWQKKLKEQLEELIKEAAKSKDEPSTTSSWSGGDVLQPPMPNVPKPPLPNIGDLPKPPIGSKPSQEDDSQEDDSKSSDEEENADSSTDKPSTSSPWSGGDTIKPNIPNITPIVPNIPIPKPPKPEENTPSQGEEQKLPRPNIPNITPIVPNIPIPIPKPPKPEENTPSQGEEQKLPRPNIPNITPILPNIPIPKPPKPEENTPLQEGGEKPTITVTPGSIPIVVPNPLNPEGNLDTQNGNGNSATPSSENTDTANPQTQTTTSTQTTTTPTSGGGIAYARGNEDAEKLPMDDEILGDKTTQGKEAYNMGTDPRAFNDNLGGYCLDKTYQAALGKTYETLTADRAEDWQYSTTDATCCCTDAILSLFKDHTKDMTDKRLNPAVDILMEALRNQRMSSDDKIKELVTLKYINTLYSFFDKDGKKMKAKSFKMPKEDGCIDTVTFKEPKDLTRKGIYREGILKETLGLLHAWRKSTEMAAEKNMIKMVK